jgi:hypothetical protein
MGGAGRPPRSRAFIEMLAEKSINRRLGRDRSPGLIMVRADASLAGEATPSGRNHLPKQSVVRRVLGGCLALALLVGLGGVSVARAQALDAVTHATSATAPQSTWCWCPLT